VLQQPPDASVGVLYVATGDPYRREVQASLASLREWHPSLAVTLVTDRPSGLPGVEEVLLDSPAFGFMDKVRSLGRSPFERTLFLDTDTFVCGDLGELFDLLDRFEFAGAHSPGRICSGSCYRIAGVPDSFAQFNSGVLLYRRTGAVSRLFEAWQDLYRQDVDAYRSLPPEEASALKFPQDQPALREAMYRSDARIATLATEYNFRTIFPCYASRAVKILHGRHPALRQLAEEINAVKGKRVYLPGRGILTAS
jgi:hypothetical protein